MFPPLPLLPRLALAFLLAVAVAGALVPGAASRPAGTAPARTSPVATGAPAPGLPQHYAIPGAHLRPGQSVPTTSHVTGDPAARTVVYVLGDSMAAQAAQAVHLTRPSWAVKPRTKSATAFALPATGSSEAARYARHVHRQVVADVAAGKRVHAVLASQRGSTRERVATIRHLRRAGVRALLVTATPQARAWPPPGGTFALRNTGPGRAATLAAAEATGAPVLDLYPIVVRRAGPGRDPHRMVKGHAVLRDAGHLSVGFADRVLPHHLTPLLR